jgi:hypothetical protein
MGDSMKQIAIGAAMFLAGFVLGTLMVGSGCI